MRGVSRRLVAAACIAVVLPGVGHATDPASNDTAAGAVPAAPPPAAENSSSPPAAEAVPVVPVPAPQSAAKPAAATTTKLDEIVVTATKRSQSVREVPSSIDVITGARLEAKSARDLQDFIDLVPGIKVQEQSGATPQKIAIRGVGPDDTTNQTVGVVLGDVSMGDPYGSYTNVDPDPWDMKTVEVLKGPQGSLFGASSLAGMIRYEPNVPLLGEWEGKSFAEWVSVKDGGADPTYGAALNIPIGSTFALRGAGVVQHDPGWIDIDTVNRQVPDANQTHRWSGRASALWQPFKRLTLLGWYMDQQAHAGEIGYVTNFNGSLVRHDAPAPSPIHRGFSLGALDARYQFDWATLVSLSAFQHKRNRFDIDTSYALPGEQIAEAGISFSRGLKNIGANGFAQEVRLVSPDQGPWTWLAGAYYSTYRANIYTDIYIPSTLSTTLLSQLLPAVLPFTGSPDGVSLANQAANPLDAGERALFGEVTRALGPVNITLGGRYYRTDVNGTIITSGIIPALGVLQPSVSANQAVLSKGFSPKFAITYHLTPDVMFYGNISRGFQYGGVNIVPVPSATLPPTFKSASLWNYETGVRTDWLHRSLRLDMTAFYMDWKDAQVSQVLENGIGAYVSNVGKVHSRGLEWTARYLPPMLKGLSLETSGSYIQATTTVPFLDSSNVLVPSGTTMPNSPTLQTASTLAYSRLLGSWRTQTAFEYTHTNSAWNDIAHGHILDPRNTFNANFTLSRTGLPVTPAFSVVVNNLTNEKKILAVTESAPNPPTAFGEVGVPVVYSQARTIILKFSLDF